MYSECTASELRRRSNEAFNQVRQSGLARGSQWEPPTPDDNSLAGLTRLARLARLGRSMAALGELRQLMAQTRPP
jgi:hypothetical protein